MVSIPACHAGDRGSIPRRGEDFSFLRATDRLIYYACCLFYQSQRQLRDSFFDIDTLRDDRGVDELLTGMTLTPAERSDDNFVQDITNHLFDGDQGMDLVALNIQRGRDHGLRGYNDYREICRVGRASSFREFGNTMSREAISKLESNYESVDDVDLFVGMFLERPEHQDAIVGRTFLCLIGDTFGRLKKGDRYFYDLGSQPEPFTRGTYVASSNE